MPAKDLKQQYKLTRAVCPYYKRTAPHSIRCEGLSDGNVLCINFAKKEAQQSHTNRYCCKDYKFCPLARIHRLRSD